MKKFLLVKDPIYLIDIIVSVGHTKKEIKEHIKKMYKSEKLYENVDEINDEIGTFSGYFFSVGNNRKHIGVKVLWIKDWEFDKEHLSILVHELFHLVFSVSKESGLVLCDESDEAFAYLQDFYFLEILKALKS